MKNFRLLYICILPLIFSFKIAAKEIQFNHTIKSHHSPELLWQQLDLAMWDSRDSWLWPKESQVIGSGLQNETLIKVTYSLGLFNPTYEYLLTVNHAQKTFSYATIPGEHPFTGGATISITEKSKGETFLNWTGSYDTSQANFFARQAFLSFERQFFSQLRQRLISFPSE